MPFSRTSTSSSSPKELTAPQIKIVSRLRAAKADADQYAVSPFETVATFNMFSNMTRDIIINGAPPAIGRLVQSRRLSSSSVTSSRPSLGSPVSSGTTLSSFLSSGLPSAERTYPLLALLEVLRYNQRQDVLDGLDVLADAGSLAQILRFQRSSLEGDRLSQSSSSSSSKGLFKSRKSKDGRNRAQSTSQTSSQPSTELRLHALLHENTLVLLSDLYQALGHLEDIPETAESRLKMAVQSLTHSPLHGSDEHRRAIQYSAGGLNFLVHFTAHASNAQYNQPFIPVSHSPMEFPGTRIDYHLIPDAVPLPLGHDLLVHCTIDGPEEKKFAVDEMTFTRVDKLLEVREGSRSKEPKNLGVNRVQTDLKKSASMVAPFLRQLREELAATKSTMVLLQQLDNGEILLVEDTEPLVALKEVLQTYQNPMFA